MHVQCASVEVQSGGKNVPNGENSDRQVYDGSCYNEHAEINALTKLIRTKISNRKLITIDLLVIRTDKNLLLKNSKPCQKCIDYMMQLPKYGYRMRYVYYSNNEGNIIKTNFTNLYHNNNHVSRRFR